MATVTQRRDIHRPASAAFDPSAYEVFGVYDAHDHGSNLARLSAQDELSGRGYSLGHGSNTHCGHCGTHIRYGALMTRADVKEYIFVGEQCLDNRFRSLTKEEFRRLRETARLNRERANLEERIDAFVAENPILERLLANGEDVRQNSFLADVRNKFVNSGRLSERQIAAIQSAFLRDAARKKWAEEKKQRQEKIAAERAALVAAGVKAPEGRVAVKGEVVSVKWRESGFGPRSGTYKITVKTDEGWLCWVSLPSQIDATEVKGKRVSLVATLTRSTTDQTFAFGKRPSNVSIN